VIGYTTDNELAFRSQGGELDMAISVLGYTASSLATKAALVAELKTKYSTVGELNTAWGTSFASWSTVEGKVTVTSPTAAYLADMRSFVTTVAKKYYSTWLTTIRKYDANHLYLGSKCDYLSADIIEGMKGSVDVISLNRYAKSLDADFALLDNYDIPFYLSEFGASTARGNNFASGVSAAMADTQAARAVICENVFRQAIANKNCVGAHFFRLYDDPVTGSYKDGANGNFGLCDIADTPYTELVQMFQRVNQDIYKR
jgi:agarase